MTKHRFRAIIFISILTFTMAYSSVALATPTSKRAKLARLKNQADSIDRQIQLIDEEYLQSKLKLGKISTKVHTNTQDLANTQKKLIRNRNILSKRIRAMYMKDADSSIDFLVSTKSFNELVTNWGYINRISENDARIIKETDLLRVKIERARKSLKANLAKQKSLVSTLASKKSSIENEIARKKRLISGLESDLRSYSRAQERRALRTAASLVNQQPESEPVVVPTNAPRSSVVQIAMKYLGRPYRWGAAGPSSFDCSGLTMYVYAQVGVGLPHSSRAQFGVGQFVPRSALQPGDLVFRGSPIHHVGIYVGNGQMIHAPQSGDVVKISSAFSGRYAGARRP